MKTGCVKMSDKRDDRAQDYDFLLHQLMEIGELLLSCGAEVNRVEDTLIRMGECSGAARMNVFVITSSIVITMQLPDGRAMTQTRRITGGATDFTRLEKLNALSRRYCAGSFPVSELREEVEALKGGEEEWFPAFLGGCALAAGSFAVFFGGGAADGAAAALFGLLIGSAQKKLQRITPNPLIFNLLCSSAIGALITFSARLMPFLNVDMIVIGDIMLLIPGLAMTNAVRDVLVGDTISGIMRLVESLLWAGGIACGVLLSMLLPG